MKLRNKKQTRYNRGFTLIELLTVFSISAIIAAITIASYPDFTSNVELENVALDIALTIREAQVYGVGAKEVDIGTGQFDYAYGVHFDTGNKNSFVVFADKDGNGVYNDIYEASTENLETIPIKSGFRIVNLCVNFTCTLAGWNSVNFTFKRPNPDAKIKISAGSTASGFATWGTVEIENIKTGKTKTITVTNTGQISVQ